MGTSRGGRASLRPLRASPRRRWAPGIRSVFDRALAREVEERRFFLWLPVAAMGGVALNLAADREPALWLPALLTLAFAGLAFAARARPVALGALARARGALRRLPAMGLRTARVAAPVLDRIRIVKLEGFVEEVDLRPVGARMVSRSRRRRTCRPKRRRAACG